MHDNKRFRYPLGEHARDRVRTRTGKSLSELTLDNIISGQVEAADLSTHSDTLRTQADIAEQAGFPQLAANFRRAAELTDIPDRQVLAIYEALRPYRVTHAQLLALADELEREYGAVENAGLLREAAEAYHARGLA
jgi:propanediol dehydratase small subunit